MPARVLLTFGAAVLALFFIPSRAAACSCIRGIPVCETFWRTSAVFAGEVIDITPVPSTREPQLALNRVVRFRVKQTFRGELPGEIDVRTGSGGGDCGYPFIKGTSYLVYAQLHAGQLGTGICSGTRPLAQAADDLEYFRVADSPTQAGRIFGTVVRQAVKAEDPLLPLSGYTVTASDGKKEWKASTGPDGRYELKGIPPGLYTVEVTVPAGESVNRYRERELIDPRGCIGADFYVRAVGPALAGVERSGNGSRERTLCELPYSRPPVSLR